MMPDADQSFHCAMGGTIVADRQVAPATGAVLSLIFAKGQRPDCAAVAALASTGSARFAVSHGADGHAGWLELLVMGLALDCHGLAPSPPGQPPLAGPVLGLADMPDGEAVTLQPGPHLADAGALVPVVRALALLGLELSALPGLLAVCWNPAASWMAPAYFRKVTGDWLAGGPFPALGLTSLRRSGNGAMDSQGLAFFTGQEITIPAASGLSPSDQARIAVRLINDLVEREPLVEPEQFKGPGGEVVVVAPITAERRLRVMVRRR